MPQYDTSRRRSAVSSNAAYARHHPRASLLRLAQIPRNLIFAVRIEGRRPLRERERERERERRPKAEWVGQGNWLFDKKRFVRGFLALLSRWIFCRPRQIENYCLMSSDFSSKVPSNHPSSSTTTCHSLHNAPTPTQIMASQRSLHNAPIFRLLLKVAVNGTHQCDYSNFCGSFGSQHLQVRAPPGSLSRAVFDD